MNWATIYHFVEALNEQKHLCHLNSIEGEIKSCFSDSVDDDGDFLNEGNNDDG